MCVVCFDTGDVAAVVMCVCVVCFDTGDVAAVVMCVWCALTRVM